MDPFKDLNSQFNKLRALYQEYFTGAIKLEPRIQRERFERLLTLENKASNNISKDKFRIKTLFYSYKTHAEKWDRMLRRAENELNKKGAQPKVKKIKNTAEEKIRDQVFNILGKGLKATKLSNKMILAFKNKVKDSTAIPDVIVENGKLKMKIRRKKK